MSTDTSNSAFKGQIVDTLLSASNLQNGVGSVLSEIGIVGGPLNLVAGGNGSGVNTVFLTPAQVVAAQQNPLVVNSAGSNTITLACTGLSGSGGVSSSASFILGSALGMTGPNNVAALRIARQGVACAVNLQGVTAKEVLSAVSGQANVLISPTGVSLGTVDSSAITIISSTGGLFA